MAAQTNYYICSFLSGTIYTKLDAITLPRRRTWRRRLCGLASLVPHLGYDQVIVVKLVLLFSTVVLRVARKQSFLAMKLPALGSLDPEPPIGKFSWQLIWIVKIMFQLL